MTQEKATQKAYQKGVSDSAKAFSERIQGMIKDRLALYDLTPKQDYVKCGKLLTEIPLLYDLHHELKDNTIYKNLDTD